MTYAEARRKRQRIEAEYLSEMYANKSLCRGDESAKLKALNKDLAHAIYDEARANRDDVSRISGG